MQTGPKHLGRVYDHAVQRGLPAARPAEQSPSGSLESSIDPKRSPTFRSGKAGGWRTQFSPENKQLFKDIAGDLLVQLGYERNHELVSSPLRDRAARS